MKPGPHRVFIVDDHVMIREGMARVLAQEPDLRLCGDAATAAEALVAIPKARADVVIVDLSLEGRSGLELIRILRVRYPKLPIVVHTMHDAAVYGARAIAEGACAYVTKREPSAKLVSELRRALKGETPVSVRQGLPSGKAMLPVLVDQLTEREREVFGLRGQGLTGDDIAARLFISRKTVDTHLENIKHRLGLASSAALLRCAVDWVRGHDSL